jgi:hypothetical protein
MNDNTIMNTFTVHEIIAYQLLHNSDSYDNSNPDFHKAGDDIILLAEKIKAERAICAMQNK